MLNYSLSMTFRRDGFQEEKSLATLKKFRGVKIATHNPEGLPREAHPPACVLCAERMAEGGRGFSRRRPPA
jgi:hypothetical protein